METGVFALGLRAAPEVSSERLAAIDHPMGNMRFNGGRCDASGRFWISTMCMDMALAAAVGAWYCLDERGLSPAHCDGLITPNGLAFSPDKRTMYFSDSHPSRSIAMVWRRSSAMDSFLQRLAEVFGDLPPGLLSPADASSATAG